MRARLMHDSEGRRLRRPVHWAAIASLFMALITALLGVRAAVAVHAASVPLPYEVTVEIQGKHDYNITQQRVNAQLAAHPVRSSKPLKLVLVDRWLTADETQRAMVPNGQVLITSKMDHLKTENYKIDERFSGVGIAHDLAPNDDKNSDMRYDIHDAFKSNVSVGHGPKAVIAAADTAAVLLDDSQTSSPIFWFSLVGLSAMVTAAFLVTALRFRSRWESRRRRLTVAQRKLARVVLDLEALEATYVAAEESRRPKGFTEAWEQLQEMSLSAARGEDPLVIAVYDRQTSLSQKTGDELTAFEAMARKLTALADSLMGAGSVHAKLAGTGSTMDKLSTPINDAATELLIRLEDAPGKMISGEDLQGLRDSLGALLDAAQKDSPQSDAVKAWSAAEKNLARHTSQIIRRLRRYPHGTRPAVQEVSAEHNQLRSTLGLPPVSANGALNQLKTANSLARAILGDTLSTDQASQPAQDSSAGWLRKVAGQISARASRGEEPSKARTIKIVAWLSILFCGSLIAAGIITYQVSKKPQSNYDGTGRGMVLEIDDKAGLVDEAEIRRYMEEDFDQEQHLLVAVRDAESYLKIQSIEGSEYRESTAESVRSAIWRIRNEYQDRADSQSKELPEGLTIIPLLITDKGRGIVPGLISGTVLSGNASWGSTTAWDFGSITESRYPSMEVSNEAGDFARVLERAEYEKPDFSVALLFWILTFMLFFTVLNLFQLIQFILGASGQFTRFTRGSRSLEKTRKRLEHLALGLEDSQINAVAVLGATTSSRADEAGQRLSERALMMAWREAEELSSMSLSQRMGSGFAARTTHLERLVALLDERDADVAKRARELVVASRGAGGDTPGQVVLPGQP